MPELPEVEILRKYFELTSLHKKIENVETKTDYVLKDISPQWLGRKLAGQSFKSTHRHGKFFFASLNESSDWLLLHFGMTGGLKYYKDDEKKPDFEKVAFYFKNGFTLGYIDPRKLGKVSIIPDIKEFISEHNIGPDVCSKSFTFEKFNSLLKGRRGMIKPTLMNQNIMAGIGNIYSDEILFQSGIHPETKVNNLNQKEKKEIFNQMKNIMKIVIDNNANPEKLPDSFITPLRDKDNPQCPSCKGHIERKKISGRSAYFCPACQKLKN